MDEFIGAIKAFGFNFPPKGWAFCDGQILPISQNQALFALLNNTFGGDGRTTFALPDLRGRSIVHAGTGTDLSQVKWGEKGGNETATLTLANLPSHSHQLVSGLAAIHTVTTISTGAGPAINETDGGKLPFTSGGTAPNIFSEQGSYTDIVGGIASHSKVSGTTSNAGYNNSFGIRDPYLGVYTSICLYGVFPPRD
jgi:microcystin-dependent protein